MRLLYSFGFELEGTTCTVSFFDEHYNITDAESLAQIGHQHRRKWALEIVEHFLTSTETSGVWNSIFIDNTPFSRRLNEEGWTDSIVVFEKTITRFSLQIYRFILFNLFI